ncbi:CCA tRNA nucleotidyltransferase [Rhodoluna sp. KAS3]|uniref:CCA tRNA nucleotidyltransferase n=1 Tax=Rhodoluna sp. KAS3 TaxID=942880 RepID=UPI00222EE9AB|nr:CCA tRNA nucleotidyltransferase [Rhodoluna sp. KAS3]BDS49723.1 CCA tRNA nucleotidyltransferase [Rhodoluna sp. KAS3]
MRSVAEALANLERTTDSPLFVTLGRIFTDAGHEISLVGGPVRDAFLGRKAPDLDFTTSATPDETIAILKPHVDAFWDIGRAFGTIGARMGDDTVEITTYRADKYDVDSRKPEVVFGKSLEDDLFRRDFTVNSMALRLPDKVFVDPFKGLQDLIDGVLRTPGKPEDSFSDDPLRMMRGARFASQLGFEIEPATFEAMTAMAERIEIISAERVQVELTKLMLGDNPRAGLTALVDSGLAALVLPELPALKLESDEHHHHKDVYEHTLTVVEQAIDYEKDYNLEGDFILRFAALMHDCGKPATKRLEPGGAVSFYHHDVVGAKLAAKRMKALRFDNDSIKAVSRLIELHLRFFGYSDQAWTDSAIRRYVRDADDQLLRLHALTRADVTTRNKRKADRLAHAYDDLEHRIAVIQEQEELNSLRPDLSGEQIMAILDLRPGREVGEAYKFLMELRLEEGPIGPEEAEKRLLAWWHSR